MTARDVSKEINEPVVVDNLRRTYRPFGEYNPADYPDEVAGYRLES